MKAIQANPKTIQAIFQETYVIPEFQRPYSWDDSQCLELFEDIVNFFMEHNDNNENYYLGNIVLYSENGEWMVIDGQQRLTTIMLFLNSLFSIAQTATILEECLKRKDPLTGNKVNILKIESRVIEGDKTELEDIILNANIDGNSRIKKNYRALHSSLLSLIRDNNWDSVKINAFILSVLKRVVLLPIECDSVDDALIIFNTLNNRGLPLNDADIFKAQLFKMAQSSKDKRELVKRWNNLNGVNGEIESLFRRLMHIKRAEKRDVSREIGLRKYFENAFEDWGETLLSLEKINYMNEYNVFPAKIENLWTVLSYAPNEFCLYPIVVFWYKYAILNDKKEWFLDNDKISELEKLINATIKYYYVSAIAYNSVNAVKDTTYKVCRAIMHNEDYLSFYNKEYDKTYKIFDSKLDNYEYGRCRLGLVALIAILNPKQRQEDILNLSKWEIEHILPQKGGYNNYNGWMEEQYQNKLNTLGNFVMLEKSLNIRASNEFFRKKKEEYRQSVIKEANDLLQFTDWTYQDWEKRHEEKEKLLKEYFSKLV